MFIAYTDASLKYDITYHSFYLLNTKTNEVIEKVSRSTIDKTLQAEISSIIRFLNYCNKKDIRNITIKTDSRDIVDMTNNRSKQYRKFNISYLRHKLKKANAQLIWINRRENIAHDICYNVKL